MADKLLEQVNGELRPRLSQAIESSKRSCIGDALEHIGAKAIELCPEADAGEIVREGRAVPKEHTSIVPPRAAEGVCLIRGDHVKAAPIRWQWRGWLAAGKFHVIAGAPGTGKTTLALSLAATATRKGARWPDGTINPEASDVMIWSGEDDAADTLVPRLIAMDADMRRIHFVSTVSNSGRTRVFDPSTDMHRLYVAASELKVGLIIVDPVVVAVRGDSNKNSEVRRGLQPLVDLAAALTAPVIGISHYTKGTQGRDPVERVTGSVAFGAVARIVLGTARKPIDQGGGGIIVRAKSNIGPDEGGFEYHVERTKIDSDLGEVETSRVVWGAAVCGTARQLLAAAEPQANDHDQASHDAAPWLRHVLAGGPMIWREVKELATDAGFAPRTIQRAAKSLRVEFHRSGFGKDCHTLWRLPVAPLAPGAGAGASGATDAGSEL